MSHSKFDPQKHHRRSIRLPNHDYSQPGAYFVTIVTWHRKCLFGEVVGGEMRLNDIGKIVRWEWLELPKRLHFLEFGAFVVMPNHFHGILIFHENAGATRQGLTESDFSKLDGSLTAWASTCVFRCNNGAIQVTRDQAIVENSIVAGNTDLATQLLRTYHPQRARPPK